MSLPRVYNNIYGVTVYDSCHLSMKELEDVVQEEKGCMLRERQQSVGEILIRFTENEGEIEIESKPEAKIKRVARITGYLSEVNNFNLAKQAEHRDRVVHTGVL